MGFNCLKAREPLRGGSLLFTTKSPEIFGTHFIDLGKMKGWVNLGATKWFWTWDPWTGNQHLNVNCSQNAKNAVLFINTNFLNECLLCDVTFDNKKGYIIVLLNYITVSHITVILNLSTLQSLIHIHRIKQERNKQKITFSFTYLTTTYFLFYLKIIYLFFTIYKHNNFS